MATIPGIPGPRGISVGSGLNVGAPLVTPNDFGQGQFRDLQNLGRTIQRSGSAVTDYGIQKYEKQANVEADEAFLAASKWQEETKLELAKKKENDAKNTRAELDRMTGEYLANAESSLTTPRSRELFSKQFAKRNFMSQIWASGYEDEQLEQANITRLNAKSEAARRDVYENPGMLDEALANVAGYTRELHQGAAEEVVANEVFKAQSAIAENAVNGQATKLGPGEALKMMNDPEVKAALGPAKAKELKEKYGTAAVTNDVNIMAMDLADQTQAGTMTSAQVQRTAYEKYPDDPAHPENAKLRETLLTVYDNHVKRLKDSKSLEATKGLRDITAKFMANDFNMEAMTRDEQKAIMLDDDLHQAFTRYQKFKNTEETNPDHWQVFQWERMPSGEFREWLNAPKEDSQEYSNFETFLRKTGGKQEIINRLFKHANDDGDDKQAFSGAAKFNPAEFFQNAYGDLYEKGIIWDSPENYLDDKTNTAKSRRNGFMQFYNAALAEKEKGLGRKADFMEQQDVADDMMRAARDKTINLDLSYWSQSTGRDAAQANQIPVVDVDVDALPFSERRHNRGEKVIGRSPAAGSPVANFGQIPIADARQLPPSIVDYKAKEVLRAYKAGRIGPVDYAAGDYIVYGRNNEIAIFNADGDMLGNPLLQVLPDDKAAVAQAQAENAELDRIAIRSEAEQDLNQLQNRRNELEREYNATFGIGPEEQAGRDAMGVFAPINPKKEMARLRHEERMDEIDREIAEAEARLKSLAGGGQ